MTCKKVINLKAKFLRTLNGLSKKQQIILPHGGWPAKEVQMTLIFYVNGGAVRPGNHLVSPYLNRNLG